MDFRNTIKTKLNLKTRIEKNLNTTYRYKIYRERERECVCNEM